MNCKVLIQSFIFFWIFSIAFLVPIPVFATSLTLSSNQSQIGQNDEYLVNINLSIGVANGTNYFLRGAFYQSGTTNYCGYTYNGTDWYNGPYTTNQGWQSLLPITVQNSSWSGTLQAKLDTSDSGCNMSGTYNFKIQRFTTSGNATFDTQNEQTIAVVIPTPTPTPSPTPVPTDTPTPTLKPTLAVTLTPTAKPTMIKSVSLSPTLVATLSASISGSVLGSSASPTLIAGISEKKPESINILAISSVVGGIILLISCGILFFYKWKKGKIHNENTDE